MLKSNQPSESTVLYSPSVKLAESTLTYCSSVDVPEPMVTYCSSVDVPEPMVTYCPSVSVPKPTVPYSQSVNYERQPDGLYYKPQDTKSKRLGCNERKLETQQDDTRRKYDHCETLISPKSRAVLSNNVRKQRRKEIAKTFGKRRQNYDFLSGGTETKDKESCHWTFVFDPSGRLAYWWSFVVSIAFVYNFWVLVYRCAFNEINNNNMAVWFSLDYTADFIYIVDIAFHFRTGYLDDGVLQTDSTKLRRHYMNSTVFYIDCLCLLPLDFLYLSIGFQSMLRCFRLVKIYKFWAFLDRTERHTNYPNVVRTATLLHYLFAIYHWNACIMFKVTMNLHLNQYALSSNQDVLDNYMHALYWSTLTLTTIGNLPLPKSKVEYVFVITEFVFALLLFAAILGHVANIVTSISTARKEFQCESFFCLL